MTRRTALAVLVAAACAVMFGSSALVAGELTSADWQKDLDELVEVLRKKHKNPFHRVTEADFEVAAAQLREEIPRLQEHEILVGLVRIAAMIGDGHTAVRPYDRLAVLPIKMFWFGDDLRVTGAPAGHEDIIGWRVVAIGDTPILEARQAVDALTPQGENPYFVMGWSAYWLKVPEALHAQGVVDSPDSAPYTVENDEGVSRTIDWSPMTTAEYAEVDWVSAYSPKPPFLAPQEEAIRFSTLSDGAVLYVSFRSYPGRRDVKRISKQIREAITKGGIEKLIIDLRGNGGGDFKKGLHLIKEIRKTKIHENGRVYALTDRWTFSAAMSNAAHCRDELSAFLVGEPPGERPNGYAENHGFALGESNVQASCSLRYYEFQDEDTPTLKLDHAIEPDFEAWAEGRDPVLEWVLEQ